MINDKIDLHAHYLPPAYLEYLKKYVGENPDNYKLPFWSEDEHIKQMDRLGVAFSLISISSPNVSAADDETVRTYVRRINEEGAEFVAKYPNRLGLMAELPLPNIDNSLEEIKYVVNRLGAYGFGLKTHYEGIYLGNPQFDPLMELLDAQNTVIIVHPVKPYNHFDGVNKTLPLPAFEFFVETTRAFINMVLNNVFNHYPNIKWVFPHAGAFIPLLSDRFNSFMIPVKLNSPDFDADIFSAMEHVYFDLAGFPLPKQIPIIKQNVPVSHMLFGSDAPYTPAIAGLALTGALEQTRQFTSLQKQMIFTRNAVNLFPRLCDILDVDGIIPAVIRKRECSKGVLKRKLMSKIYIMMQKKQAKSNQR